MMEVHPVVSRTRRKQGIFLDFLFWEKGVSEPSCEQALFPGDAS